MIVRTLDTLPVAVIGGGPVGLAAAAHLSSPGLPVKVYEAGPRSAQTSAIGAMSASSRPGATVSISRDDTAQTAWLAIAAGRRLARPEPSWSATISNRLRQTPELAAAIEASARVTAISRPWRR